MTRHLESASHFVLAVVLALVWLCGFVEVARPGCLGRMFRRIAR